jgi:hypothetical protein
MVAAEPESICEGSSPASVTVKEYDPARAGAWDGWLASCSGATPFHTTAWIKALERGFGYAPRCIYSERNGEITGVLPPFFFWKLFFCRLFFYNPISY